MQIMKMKPGMTRPGKSWTTTAGLPERSSQEAIVEMLRELQDIHGCISPLYAGAGSGGCRVRDSMVQAICKRYPSLKTAPYNHEIILCTGRNCASKGSITVMDELKKGWEWEKRHIRGRDRVP